MDRGRATADQELFKFKVAMGLTSAVMFSRSSFLVLLVVIVSVLGDNALSIKSSLSKDKVPIPSGQRNGNKWRLLEKRLNSESGIANNYVSAAKDSAMVSYGDQDFRKNQLVELQDQIKQQLPKESKFFDEFEGSKWLMVSAVCVSCGD